ncbi:MAG: acyltransferase [Desulfuromonas sp.]|nr:MAG: acyltransferase [Desulfuromonas sp.]
MQTTFQNLPRRRFRFGVWLGTVIMKLLGWRLEGQIPDLPKVIAVVAPHTSNWDWVVGMATALHLDLDANWLGKQSLFRGVLGGVLRWLGGIPVDRSHAHGVIAQVVSEARRRDKFLLGLAPEATRKPRDRWRSGCYYIARDAEIPLVPVRVDYSRKVIEVGAILPLSADAEETLAKLSSWYRPEMARYPENFLHHRPETPSGQVVDSSPLI